MNTAIYYPYLYPPAKWLRVAALCWDTVYSLEPSDAPPRPQMVAEFDRALGGFLETLPFSRAIEDRQVLEIFGAWVEEHVNDFRKQPFVEESDGLLRDVGHLYASKLGGVDAPMVKRLCELRLARVESKRTTIQRPEWASWAEEPPMLPEEGSPEWNYEQLRSKVWTTDDVRKKQKFLAAADAFLKKHSVPVDQTMPMLLVPRELGLHYLALCSSYVAEQARCDLATETTKFIDVVVSGSKEAVVAEVAQAVIEARVPANIEEVDPARLRELREALRHERHRFQGEVESLVKELEAIASEGQMAKLRNDALELARARAEATERAHKSARLEIAVETMGVSLAPPALLVTTASLLGTGLFAPLGSRGPRCRDGQGLSRVAESWRGTTQSSVVVRIRGRTCPRQGYRSWGVIVRQSASSMPQWPDVSNVTPRRQL
jgi:hypothetical protein